ncbi:unnamed protein product [Parascedosporium putredinis]|uniref:Uncharacterized protein n=1 Tax=Parascedosporium putredinis TaxID=1442378 RepID=A0A9P1H5G6_9PEZI|nr:unnamed protein product [Parascedosporium putredinis]CAI7996470.1 unnamed protein product [Parascedosporium putredinis]
MADTDDNEVPPETSISSDNTVVADPVAPTHLTPGTASAPRRPGPDVLTRPRYTRPLPSEEATALAEQPVNEARRRSNNTRSTRHILLHFSGSVPRHTSPEEKERPEEEDGDRGHGKGSGPGKRSRISHFWRVTTHSEKLRMHYEPEDCDARDACNFWFPQPASVSIHICDFKREGGSRYTSKLGNIEKSGPEINTDPSFRVEAGRCRRALDRPNRQTLLRGSLDPAWNYPELTMLTFVNHTRFVEKMDAFRFLSNLDVLANGVGDDPLQGLTRRQQNDVKWRAKHVGKLIDFWDIVRADFPNLLSERFLGQPSNTNVKGPLPTDNDKQALSDHDQFLNALLMTCQLRAFHRSDGYLLTFSNSTGVDYLGKPFREWLDQPDQFMHDSEISILAHVAENFIASGTSRWHYPTVEWLIVYLMTEAATKQRQKRPWERGESPRLVRKYLNCLEELRAIEDLAEQKLKLLEGMVIDAERFEAEYATEGVLPNQDDDEVETMHERIQWAIDMVREQHSESKFLVHYFETALTELFQLRSIEQNEMAIVADSQNKAVLLFTGVTIIFLPLSFFTSYFGMNLQGIVDTKKDESYFWSVCGSIGFVMVFTLVSYAFREDLNRQLHTRSMAKMRAIKGF